jgi:putative salt-induced outer membrane protein
MTEGLATRVSYRTEYNDNPAPGTLDLDNTLGVSLVMSF